MKAVLDTNVLVGGLITPEGACGRIVDLVFEEGFVPCVDARILREYQRVLPRPRLRIDRGDVVSTLRQIRLTAELLTPVPLAAALPHPADLPFLEVAKQAGAVLVTGNVRHFPAKARAGVTVASPREFLELLGQSQ